MKVQITLDTEELKVPQGWEIKGVRVAKKGEYYLCPGGAQYVYGVTDAPVVVIRKLFNIKDYACTVTAEEIYIGGVSVPQGYEVVNFRIPRCGDLYIMDNGGLDVALFDWRDAPRLIVKKTGEQGEISWGG